MQQDVEAWIEVPASDVDGRYFCMRAPDDSMQASRILRGDCVMVRQQDSVPDGDLAVVIVDDGEAMIRRVFHTDKGIILQSDDLEARPVLVEPQAVRILGRVVRVWWDR